MPLALSNWLNSLNRWVLPDEILFGFDRENLTVFAIFVEVGFSACPIRILALPKASCVPIGLCSSDLIPSNTPTEGLEFPPPFYHSVSSFAYFEEVGIWKISFYR